MIWTTAVVRAVAVIATLVVGGCASSEPSARAALAEAARADYPDRYVMVDRPDATALTQCLGVAEKLVVSIDEARDVMAVRRERDLEPVAFWTAEASFVQASLLAAGSGWLRIDRDVPVRTRAELEALLGGALSGYVFAADVVPGPSSTAQSVLALVGDTRRDESASGELIVTVEVDGSVAEVDGLDGESVPVLEFTIADGRITAIAARLPSGDEESFGYVWEYDWSAEPAIIVLPDEATPIEQVAGALGRDDPGDVDCGVGFDR